MPPSSTKKNLPGLQPASSHKWKDTSRFLENADLQLLKKKKSKASISRMPAQKEVCHGHVVFFVSELNSLSLDTIRWLVT
jgi:hypothetical protein